MIATLASLALGQEPEAEVRRQYREVALMDGRTLLAEVLATRAEGMVLAVPQGEIVVSYEILQDMAPVDAATYAGQGPWVAVVAVPPTNREQITTLLDGIPSLVVWTADGTVGEPSGPVDLGEAEQAALRGCGTNPACVRGAFGQGAGRKWVITLTAAGGGFTVEGALTGTDTLHRIPVANPTDAAVWTALHQAIGLEAPKAPPPIRAAAVSDAPRDRGSRSGLAFAPVPGLPALAEGDGGRFGLALATAVPASAAWVAVVGTHAQSVPEHIGLGAAGFYAITVLTNQIFAPGDARRR